MKVYNKLVRDRISQIFEASGKKCVTATLSVENYLKALNAKPDEGLTEYHKNQNTEELAGLLELIRACTAAR